MVKAEPESHGQSSDNQEEDDEADLRQKI